MEAKKSKLYLIIAMIIFGTLGVFVKKINISSGEIALFRSLIAIFVIVIFMLITKQKIIKKIEKNDLILTVISGMAMGINWVLFFEAYNHTAVSIATLCYYFAPIIVTVLCPIFFKEKLKAIQIICFVASTIGICLITVSNNIGDNNHIIGVLLSLGAAVLYATVVMLNKQVKGVSGLHRTIIQFIGALIILMPYVIISTGFQVLDISKEGLISLLIIGVIHTGIAYCLYFTSVKNLTGQNVAILSYIDPVVAVMASVLILKEDITIIQIIGGVIIIGFTLYNELVTVKINKEINNENKSNS